MVVLQYMCKDVNKGISLYCRGFFFLLMNWTTMLHAYRHTCSWGMGIEIVAVANIKRSFSFPAALINIPPFQKEIKRTALGVKSRQPPCCLPYSFIHSSSSSSSSSCYSYSSALLLLLLLHLCTSALSVSLTLSLHNSFSEVEQVTHPVVRWRHCTNAK